MQQIRVWDFPTRLFHWLLVVNVCGSVGTGLTGGNLMSVHEWFGISMVGLIAFRVSWGFLGPASVRFTRFVRGPVTIARYLRGQWQGIGHNPLGALSVVAMLGLLGAQAMTGLVANDDIAFSGPLRSLVDKATSDWITGIHHTLIWWLLALIVLHLLAVAFYILVKKDDILTPMLTGWKSTGKDMDDSADRPVNLLALSLSIAVGVVAAWLAAGGALPPPPPPPSTPSW